MRSISRLSSSLIGPEPLAQRDRRAGILETLFRQAVPGPPDRLTHDDPDAFRAPAAQIRVFVGERFLVPLHHLLDHLGGGYPRQVRAARRCRQRQPEADQIVRRIADYGLVEVADLDIDLAVGIGQRTQIADVTIPANPDRRALRHLADV
jgi:hypothetical protein